MSGTFSWLTGLISPVRAGQFLNAGIVLVVGLLIARVLSSGIEKLFARGATPQQAIIFRKISYYVMVVLVIVSVMRELEFDMSVFLGAAGIMTVALGFASQTSVSNIISGLFLIVDKPFKIGDVVKIGDTVGTVNTIELLSVKIRTFQNGLVRIPNEVMFKTEVLNYTHYPIRRIDVEVGVAYKEDIGKVKRVLFDVAKRNPLCLEEPPPLFIFVGYGESSLDMKFCVWTMNENYLDLMNSIKQEIKEIFDNNGIEIPFPHCTLYTGSVTDPFPVTVVNAD